MPIDFVITYEDGRKETIYLPLTIMRGNKAEEPGFPERVRTQRWPWTYTRTEIILDEPLRAIQSLSIDPSLRLADINREDNDWIRE